MPLSPVPGVPPPSSYGAAAEASALAMAASAQAAHAEQLAALLHPFGRGMVLANLIPYNYNGFVHRTGRMLSV